MPRKKTKFIDKKNSVSFRLVHRSQQDPLAADDTAGQHVLVPLDGTTPHHDHGASTCDPLAKRKELVRYGVYYEDDYNYLQHLRSVDEYYNVHLSGNIDAVSEDTEDDPEGVRLFRKTPRGYVPIVPDVSDHGTGKDVKQKMGRSLPVGSKVGTHQVGSKIQLPSTVFASRDESDVGLIHRGGATTQQSGPLIGWDPELVAALDDDFDLDDPDNLLEDDFVLKANEAYSDSDADEENSDEWTDDSDADDDEIEDVRHRLSKTQLDQVATGDPLSHLTSGAEMGDFKARIEAMKVEMARKAMARMGDDVCSSEEGDLAREFGFDDEEETKSRFTEYSMTSSVIRRNDQLTLLDDRFEKLYEQYDTDQIGGLDAEEIKGRVKPEPSANDFATILQEFELQHTKHTASEVLQKLRNMEALQKDDDSEDEEKLVKLVYEEKSKEQWDCESILSTYSSLYNHPKKIVEEPKSKNKIQLSNKTGLPLGVLPECGPTNKQIESMDYEGLTRLRTAPTFRQENETSEERKSRKKAIKEERKERRMEKKANTAAFKDEVKKQKKNLNDLQQNIQGIKIF